ncbi:MULTISPECIES: LLM class flavin-dependent oxidoreductase [Snodgrassella]|uniref:LLM class flavin-dependent oxidoreductase n=1 Tax=Snodgrassella TaxID=1193515 RepID=UPI00226AB3B6|nr:MULTISPECIES: LLM class flavin-dependent oxidoreductase [unclassified Snodgrassella]
MAIPVSILNLVPRRDNGTAASAIRNMLRLAQVAEQLGFVRYWIAEHHNMPMVVSSATQILIGHTLSHTHHIRVGSGGVMLPNHSPLLVAEQYGTLATIYPHRVDLGLGRAPGTDRVTAAALRRQLNDVSLKFADDVVQLQRYLGDEQQQGLVKAYPGMGTHIPLYILGSSTDSAYLAASLGLPYVFAAHFAPRFLDEAAAIYRERFQPSAQLAAPFFMLCLNLVAAATDDEALYLQTTQLQSVLGLIRNNRKALHQPVPSMDGLWTAEEEAYVRNFTACTLLGAPETVRQQLEGYVLRLQPDEVMAVSYIYDMDKLLESYNIFKTVADNVG